MREATPNTRSRLKSQLDEKHAGKISPVLTFLTLFKGFVGTGVLFLPKGFYTGGWGFMSVALLLSCGLTIFTAIKLIDIRLKFKLSFSEIGAKAFGVPGKMAVDFFLMFTQIIFVCAYIKFIVGSVNNILESQFKVTKMDPWWIGLV